MKPKYRTKVMNANLKYKVLMYVHAKLAKRLGAAHHSVSSTQAQICWQKSQALFRNMLALGENETQALANQVGRVHEHCYGHCYEDVSAMLV